MPHRESSLDLAYVASLKDRSVRERTGRYFIEGARFVLAARDAGAKIALLVVSPPLMKTPGAQIAAHRVRALGVPVLRVAPEELRAVARSQDPQGVGAVVEQWRGPPPPPSPYDCWVLLESARAEGNVGTILRTCEATGASSSTRSGTSVTLGGPPRTARSS